ncbi:hypothetical protein [Alterisphingorhabdus coralli]|uniref:Uncharacterized protein n=1 Tax=Alterisphingorhabdus coralli TaxID=3071408 RepID=A0AA97F7V7_9SPHN|nr:hypothetical protein [Parasphingorhabdus sp. SCSIO 66989]WOE75791.1 hypothetical protein RB602_03495 [Parasphingorhabdus sp. SCSIO 66989]
MMMQFRSVLVATTILALPVGAGALQSDDAALEKLCRSTEVTAPDSCPCTITNARAVNVSDRDMQSLFTDDGHSNPVDQGVYGRFWQVKAQCIAEATMASMGISADNPLPGVPANMRPQMPQVVPPTPAPVAPAAQTGSASSKGVLSVPSGVLVETRAIQSNIGGPDITEETYKFANFDFIFGYDQAIADNPGLFYKAKQRGQKELAEWQKTYDRPERIRPYTQHGWSTYGSLDRLLTVSVTGSTNNRPQGQFLDAHLWDSQLDREIGWTDVFDTRIWNGKVRRQYCASLQAERIERGTERNTSCPDFDQLLIGFEQGDAGQRNLVFSALAYIAGSYAEGPYDVKMLLDDSLLAAVKPEYRSIFGLSENSSSAISLVDRLGRVILGPPHFKQPPDCVEEIYLAPDNAGSPRSIEDIQALIVRSGGLIFATGGMLGVDGRTTGLVLDGRFRSLPNSEYHPETKSNRYSTSSISFEYFPKTEYTQVSYGGWSVGEAVLSVNGEAARIPALSQFYQCT